MKDFLGQKLEVGDKVVYLRHCRTGSQLYKGIVKKLTDKMVTISSEHRSGYRCYPYKVVKVKEDTDNENI